MIMMNSMMRRGLAMLCIGVSCVGIAADDNSVGTEKGEVPKSMKLLLASFGTIDSQSEVEGWLSDLLRPQQNIASLPNITGADKVVNSEKALELRINWQNKVLECWESEAERTWQENRRREQALINLKTATLSDSSQRYIILGRDYLQSAIRKHKSGKLVEIIDRGNMTIQQVEKQIKGDSANLLNGADCILSVAVGDREVNSKTLPIDNAGTKVKRTTYTMPYVGKVRDLAGNVLLAFNGKASVRTVVDNVIETESADPSRELIENACEEIAKEIVGYFTCELNFKVKVPDGFDIDDVEIRVDGRDVDGNAIRVLAIDHSIKAELLGCKTIEKQVSAQDGESSRTVKLNFKKSDEN